MVCPLLSLRPLYTQGCVTVLQLLSPLPPSEVGQFCNRKYRMDYETHEPELYQQPHLHSSSIPQLPGELHDAIIDAFSQTLSQSESRYWKTTDFTRGLSNCSLVSRRWAVRCQHHLLHTISVSLQIDPKRDDSSCDTTESSSLHHASALNRLLEDPSHAHLRDYVKEVELTDHQSYYKDGRRTIPARFPWIQTPIASLLRNLPSVESWVIEGLVWRSEESSGISDELRDAIRTSLRSCIRLRLLMDFASTSDFLQLINSAPLLKSLEFWYSTVADTPVDSIIGKQHYARKVTPDSLSLQSGGRRLGFLLPAVQCRLDLSQLNTLQYTGLDHHEAIVSSLLPIAAANLKSLRIALDLKRTATPVPIASLPCLQELDVKFWFGKGVQTSPGRWLETSFNAPFAPERLSLRHLRIHCHFSISSDDGTEPPENVHLDHGWSALRSLDMLSSTTSMSIEVLLECGLSPSPALRNEALLKKRKEELEGAVKKRWEDELRGFRERGRLVVRF